MHPAPIPIFFFTCGPGNEERCLILGELIQNRKNTAPVRNSITRPHCIPQYTTRRFPVDQLRRTAIPCYCPHSIRDIRPSQEGNPQKPTDQLSKREQNNRLVNILQVVGIGMPLPHSTPYFSPNIIVVSRNISKHQHRIRELAAPGSMKLHLADVSMETL